jgi:hypothetical protein
MTNPAVPIIFADSETDDLDSKRRQQWDVALIRREPDGTETEHQFYVSIDTADSDPFALRVGRYWERHPDGRYFAGLDRFRPIPVDSDKTQRVDGFDNLIGRYLTPRAAAARVARITHGAHVVGAIPSFDTITFENLLRDNGLSPQWHYHLIDVEALAVGYMRGLAEKGALGPYTGPLGVPLAPPWKSDDLSGLLGIQPPTEEERHTALGDARWAMRIYDTVMGVARDETGRVAA